MQLLPLLLAGSSVVGTAVPSLIGGRRSSVLSLFAPAEDSALEKIRSGERLLNQAGSFLGAQKAVDKQSDDIVDEASEGVIATGIGDELSKVATFLKVQQPGGPLGQVGNGLKDVGAGIGDIFNKGKEAASRIGGMFKKPAMSGIDSMRAEMCIRRPRILKHKACMKFMTKHCKSHTTGQGYCKEWWKMLADACYRAQKQGSDPKGYCEMLHTLKDVDTDKDKVSDLHDPFPYDPNESADEDGDGIGDNVDEDRDGDGVINAADACPDDPSCGGASAKSDIDGDGIPDGEDSDMDGDGTPNDADQFPEDAKEWADSDGDGIGDNSDAFPNDSRCKSASQPCPPGLASAGLAPGEASETEHEMDAAHGEVGMEGNSTGVADAVEPEPNITKEAVPENFTMPDKTHRPLPNQGYNEFARGPPVEHSNMTELGDWGKEWPQNKEEREYSFLKHCVKHPDSEWCVRYHNRDPRAWDH